MQIGDLVTWKFRVLTCLDGDDVGLVVSRATLSHDPWPYWNVLFGERGVLMCRESDLVTFCDAEYLHRQHADLPPDVDNKYL